jgi:hypothetical protein
VTACNLRPPPGHPFHGSGVACHLPAGHSSRHAWELPAEPLPWLAEFLNGPIAEDQTHVFVMGPVWQWIVLAPMPETTSRARHWVIVGGDGIGGTPEEPWPEQVTYRLVEVIPGDVVGEPGAIARYGLVDPRPRPAVDEGPRYWGD